MAFLGALICLVLIIISLPYMRGKDVLRTIGIMALTVVGALFLWWLAVPLLVIWAVVIIVRNVYVHGDKEQNP